MADDIGAVIAYVRSFGPGDRVGAGYAHKLADEIERLRATVSATGAATMAYMKDIDRLRAALERIEKLSWADDGRGGWEQACDSIHEIARAALATGISTIEPGYPDSDGLPPPASEPLIDWQASHAEAVRQRDEVREYAGKLRHAIACAVSAWGDSMTGDGADGDTMNLLRRALAASPPRDAVQPAAAPAEDALPEDVVKFLHELATVPEALDMPEWAQRADDLLSDYAPATELDDGGPYYGTSPPPASVSRIIPPPPVSVEEMARPFGPADGSGVWKHPPASAEPTDADLLAMGYAPGGYVGRCDDCREQTWNLDKRARVCRPCAVKRWQRRAVQPSAAQGTESTVAPPGGWPHGGLASTTPAAPVIKLHAWDCRCGNCPTYENTMVYEDGFR